MRSKVTPRKIGVGLKSRRELIKKRLGWTLAWWKSTKKKETSHLLGLRGRYSPIKTVLKPALQLKQSSLCSLHRRGNRGARRPNGQIISVKRAADGKRQRNRKIIDEERKKYGAKNGSLWNTLTDSKEMTIVILINRSSAPIRKERLSPTSKAKQGGRPAEMSLWKRAGCQTE